MLKETEAKQDVSVLLHARDAGVQRTNKHPANKSYNGKVSYFFSSITITTRFLKFALLGRRTQKVRITMSCMFLNNVPRFLNLKGQDLPAVFITAR